MLVWKNLEYSRDGVSLGNVPAKKVLQYRQAGNPFFDYSKNLSRISLRSLKDCATMNRKLTSREIGDALNTTDLPPILIPEEAAQLLRLKVSTLYRHVSEGRYGGAVKRGKPLRFWRDRLIQEYMR